MVDKKSEQIIEVLGVELEEGTDGRRCEECIDGIVDLTLDLHGLVVLLHHSGQDLLLKHFHLLAGLVLLLLFLFYLFLCLLLKLLLYHLHMLHVGDVLARVVLF